LFLELEIFHTKVLDKIKNIFYVQSFFFENRNVYENVEKWGRTGQATDDSIIAQERCDLVAE
jgi:hypothetical protein